MVKLTLIALIVVLVMDQHNQVEGQDLAIGQRCRRDSQCASDNCCGFPLRRCWECCRDRDCDDGEKCT